MENNSNQNQKRRRNNRSSGGNRNRQGGNRSRNRNRNRNRSRRKPEPPPTAMEKFLHTVTFGILGKAPRPKVNTRSDASRARAKQENAPAKPKNTAPKRKKQRTEVTSGRLYVGNLSYDTDEPELEELFRGAGNVLSAEVVTNTRTQQSKGFAFVEMGSIEEAKRAVEILDEEEFMGRKLIVSGARSEGPREGDDSESPKSESSDSEPAMAESGSEGQA